jgi:replication-associated recombination protein RarA
MTPEEFIKNGPQKPEDLIGKARTVAKVFCARVKSGVTMPIKLLCYGPPGIGKSAVCKIISQTLVEHPVSLRHMSAKQITIDHIRDWMMDFRYHNDQWRVFWIEEVDAVTSDVETLLLHLIDLLPEKNAILATSNERISGIEGRFQSRMQAIRFEKPSVDEVEKFLMDRWPELGKVAREIAESNDGDVRASLNDAALQLDVMKYNTTGEQG